MRDAVIVLLSSVKIFRLCYSYDVFTLPSGQQDGGSVEVLPGPDDQTPLHGADRDSG